MLAMTSDYHGSNRKSADIKGALTRIAQAGFSHVHWCHEWTGDYLYSTHEMLQIKAWCDELGLKVKGVHATPGDKKSDLKDYTSPNEYNRLAGIELVKNRVDLACLLGTDAIVMHIHPVLPQLPPEKQNDPKEEHFVHAFKSLDELEPYCKTRGVKICYENGGWPTDLGCRIYDILYKRYDKEFLGLCLDTGHAWLHCKERCLEYAERYNDRLFLIHIHDNDGTGDQHIIPFEGGFDWEGFAKLLARSPYTFPILMECQTSEEGGDMAWLKKAFDAGSRFTAMVEEYRK